MGTFSYFDVGKTPSESEPERLPTGKATTKSLEEPNSSVCFYHGFVLGLIVELSDRYTITSNRESGFGRYDVVLEPRNQADDAMILEFKVQDTEDGERELADTVQAALKQIDDKDYEASFVAKGIDKERIRKLGFAFCGALETGEHGQFTHGKGDRCVGGAVAIRYQHVKRHGAYEVRKRGNTF